MKRSFAIFALLAVLFVLNCVAAPQNGFLTDSRDGQIYRTVKIGKQVWMTENLNFKTDSSWCYDDKPENCKKYGRLYHWSDALTACPSGWTLPSRTGLVTLFDAIGGQDSAGLKLKSSIGWNKNGVGADDYSFTALPAGYGGWHGGHRYFCCEGDDAYFASSSEHEYDREMVYSMHLNNYKNVAYLAVEPKSLGFSIRCIEDMSVTPSSVVVDSMTDSRDGQTYRTVKIGEQVWMAEDLNYKADSSWCYDDKSENCKKYGRLYTWYAAKKSCAIGWHLPSEGEFEILLKAVGEQGNIVEFGGSKTAGKVIKSKTGWNEKGGGIDSYSFSALPAGVRVYNEQFSLEGQNTGFWSSTENYTGYAFLIHLDYHTDGAHLYHSIEYNGYSVRCVKD